MGQQIVRHSPADKKERRERGAPSAKLEFLEGDHGEAHCSPTCHEGAQRSRLPHAAHEGPHATKTGDALKGSAACAEKPTLNQVYPEGLQPMKETHAAAGHEQLQHVGRTLLQHFMKDCILLCPTSGPPCQRREGV